VTADHNLITLCHTCHSGLDPHEDLALFDYLGLGFEHWLQTEDRAKYLSRIHEYRRHMLGLTRRHGDDVE
jgi:hypothetical protein